MMCDDPLVRKRLDDAGQRARDQELRIIILEKEVEQLKAMSLKAGEDSIPGQRDDKSKARETDRKRTPPKAGHRDDVISRNKVQPDEKSKHRNDSESRSADHAIGGHPSARRAI